MELRELGGTRWHAVARGVAGRGAVPLLLLLLQRPLGPLRVEPHALERAALGAVAAVEVEALVGCAPRLPCRTPSPVPSGRECRHARRLPYHSQLLAHTRSPGAGSSIHRDSETSHGLPTHCLLCFSGAVTLVWFSQQQQRTRDGKQRELEASQVVLGVAFPDEFAARCYRGARDVTAGCLRLICRSRLDPLDAAARMGAAFASATASPGPSGGGVPHAETTRAWPSSTPPTPALSRLGGWAARSAACSRRSGPRWPIRRPVVGRW
jgi:hypothetical protein